MPVASIARPISPPSASISRTRWPFAVPPIAGLHGISATVSGESVQSPTRQPSRAAAHAASHPACPAPMTTTSKSCEQHASTFPTQNLAKIWRSRSSGVRRPVISSSACARGAEIGQHQFFGRAGGERVAARGRCASRAASTSARCRTFEIAGASRQSSRDRSAPRRSRSRRRVESLTRRRRHARRRHRRRPPVRRPSTRAADRPCSTTTIRGAGDLATMRRSSSANGVDPSTTTSVSAATRCACRARSHAFGFDRDRAPRAGRPCPRA